MRFRLALTAAAVALVAGCSTTVSGTAVPAPLDPLAGATVFGDQKTVNWCSLVSLDPVKKFGTPERPADDGFDECYVYVDVDGENGFGVSVGAPDDVYPEDKTFDAKTLKGGLKTATVYDEGTFCQKLLVLSDGMRLSVLAGKVDDPSNTVKTDMCDAVDAVVADLADHIGSGQVARHHRVSTATLRTADACAATPAAAVTGRPGLEKVTATPVPLGHLCVWEDAKHSYGPLLVVSFDVETDLDSEPDLRKQDVGGQQVHLAEDKEQGVCTAIVGVRPLPGSGADQLEAVEVFVDPGESDLDPCATAAEVAVATRATLVG